MRPPIGAIFVVVWLLVLACASERAEPARPLPASSPEIAPASTPTVTPAATPAPAVTPTSAPPATVEEPPEDAGSAAAVEVAPAVDRKRCPLFPPSGGASSWRAVPELTGLSEAELAACYGDPVDAKGERRVFHFPRDCSYRRAELELTLKNGRVGSARVRSRVTGQHCLSTD